MAAARQKEMKVSITVVATKTLTAGRRMLVLLDIGVGIYSTAGTHKYPHACGQTLKITHQAGSFQPHRPTRHVTSASRAAPDLFPLPGAAEKPRLSASS